jgi:hypothetical protein
MPAPDSLSRKRAPLTDRSRVADVRAANAVRAQDSRLYATAVLTNRDKGHREIERRIDGQA